MKLKLCVYFISALALFQACKKDKSEPDPIADPGYQYYPLETYMLGRERIYDVDSIVYRQVSTKPDTFIYQVRELLKDTFTDLSGQLAFVVEKSVRASDSASWMPVYLYTVNRNSIFAEEFSNNTRFVKMVFPLREGKKFNSNIYNTMPETVSRIQNIDKAYDINNLHFDSTVTITHMNDSDLLNRDLHVERFARGVGLLTKEYISIDKIITGQDVKLEGSRYTYRLRSFSK